MSAMDYELNDATVDLDEDDAFETVTSDNQVTNGLLDLGYGTGLRLSPPGYGPDFEMASID